MGVGVKERDGQRSLVIGTGTGDITVLFLIFLILDMFRVERLG